MPAHFLKQGAIVVSTNLFLFPLLAALLVCLLPAAPAHAQNGTLTRSFVSSSGVDTNACTITAPCASFATAYTKIGANGIIAALDPGKYGPITITGPVTINGNGWAAVTAPATNYGFTINAGASDKVTLIGLEVDGAGAGYGGIIFNSGASLTINNCVLQNFVSIGPTSGEGIIIAPTSGTVNFTITNTTAANNQFTGIAYFPQSGSANANGVIDHVVADANETGIYVDTSNSTGTTAVTISNSITSNNSDYGIRATGSLTLSIDNVSVSENLFGIEAYGTANVLLGRSVITANGTGVLNDTSPNTFYSYGNNQINGNTTDGYTSLNPSFTTH
jgi:hypothetical protein